MVKRAILIITLGLIFASLGFVSAGDVGSGFVYDLSVETAHVLYIGDVLGFNAAGGRHTLLLVGIKDNKVTVRVAQPIQSATLGVGEETRFDFNDDGMMDFYLRVSEILPSEKAANVTIKTISEKVPIEESPSNVPVTPVTPAQETPSEPAREEPRENISDYFANQTSGTSGKSSSSWIWIVLVVIVIGAAIYFAIRTFGRGGRPPHLS